MATFLENAYSLVHLDNTADTPSLQELRNQLEKGNDESKVDTMKKILTVMLNGDPMPNLLMHIIRFVMPSKSKPLKKLLYLYYEICPKLDANGKLKQEMILVWYDTGHETGVTSLVANRIVATAFEWTFNMLTNTYAATLFDFCASYANLNSSSPY